MANDKPTPPLTALMIATIIATQMSANGMASKTNDSLGKDPGAPGFSDKRVISESITSFDVTNACEFFISFDNTSRRQDSPAMTASMAP